MGRGRWDLRERARDERGFTVVEVMMAMVIIAVGFFALIAATGSSSRLIAQGKEREVATSEANAQLEDVHNIPYAQVELSSQPAHSADSGNPDYYVSSDGTGYDYKHNGSFEDLIVDTTNGQVTQTSTVTVGSVALSDYEYVTWVDDPSISGTQDYKRVTIVVVYTAADSPGRAHAVQASTLLSAGSVTIGGAAIGPAQGSASPTPSGAPTPTPSTSSCSSDGPTGGFSILSGTGAQTGYTASTAATISLAPVDACTPILVQLSNDNSTFGQWFTYDSANPSTTWTLTSGDGTKSVWAHFRDSRNEQTTVGPQTIILDQTKPTTPGTLTRSVSCSGNNRTVNLTWGTATDANLIGYRIYVSVNGGAYSFLASTSTSSGSDTESKSLTSLNFKVVAYDKAGNEGIATNVVSLSKNQCR